MAKGKYLLILIRLAIQFGGFVLVSPAETTYFVSAEKSFSLRMNKIIQNLFIVSITLSISEGCMKGGNGQTQCGPMDFILQWVLAPYPVCPSWLFAYSVQLDNEFLF